MKTIYEVSVISAVQPWSGEYESQPYELDSKLLATFDRKEDAERFKAKFEHVTVGYGFEYMCPSCLNYTIEDAQKDMAYEATWNSEAVYNALGFEIKTYEYDNRIHVSLVIHEFDGLFEIHERQIYTEEDCDFDKWDTSKYGWLKEA